MNRYYSLKLQFLHVNASNLCKITITHALGENISLPNKFPLVLPFVRLFTDDKTSNKFFFYINLYTWSINYGCYYSDYSKNPEGLNHSIRIHAMIHSYSRTTPNLPSKRNQCKAKQSMSLQYTCAKKPLKMMCCWRNNYCCVHASRENYGKPSDCNKIIRRKFNGSFISKVL